MLASSAPAPPTLITRLVAGAVVAGAIALSLAGLVADAAAERNTPSQEALAAAVAAVREGYEPGDAVVVQPSWVEDLWLPLVTPDGDGRAVDPSGLQQGQRYDAMALLEHPRMWVIAAFGAPAALAVPWLDAGPPLQSSDLGSGVSVALYALPKLEVLGRLTRDVARLSVARQAPDARPKRCPWRARAHECDRARRWLNVGVETAHVYHRDVSWLHVVPGPGTTALLIDWRAPVGPTLVVRAGFSLDAIRKESGSETRLTVRAGDTILDDVVLAPHRFVEVRRVIALPRGHRGPLRFEIRATDHDHRHLYLEADVVGELPEAVQRWAEDAP